jgi:hypothetical protein
MKKLLIVLYFVFLVSSFPANALEISNLYPAHVNNGNGYFSTTEEHNIYLVVNENIDSIELVTYTPEIQRNTLIHASADATLTSGIVASNGYIYFTSTQGVFKYLKKGVTNPVYTNDTTNIQTISGAEYDVRRLRQEGDYIYYMPSATVVKRFNINTGLASTYLTMAAPSGTFIDFDVCDGEIYRLFATHTGSLIVYINDNNIYSTGITSGSNANGAIQVMNGDLIYYGFRGYNSNYAKILYLNGTVKSDWNFPTPTNDIYRYGTWYIGSKDTVCMGRGVSNAVELVEVADFGRTFADSSSSSSDGTSTTNPLIDIDSPEDVKEFAVNYSSITWIMLIFLFLMAAMGGRK